MLKSNPIIICGAQCGGAFKQFVIRCLLQAYSVHIRQGLGFEVVLVDEVFFPKPADIGSTGSEYRVQRCRSPFPYRSRAQKVFGKAVDRIKNIPDLIVRGNGFALPEVDRDTALTEELFKFPQNENRSICRKASWFSPPKHLQRSHKKFMHYVSNEIYTLQESQYIP